MSNKQFSERLNKELDEIGVPQRADERVEVFAKLINIPRGKAEAILNGNIHSGTPLLQLIAEELEVNPEWLLGKSDKRHN
ncbi:MULTISPECIES: hypothetical protein [Legionella]|uniref:XRE family transcriptional regulator n=1 Tax=Legionella septentrionalis TaxID=2498109 RepID=A0A433JIK8_9GAMM|nr:MULTISPECIES: hypothetical protein [Legionella]MCP0914535.1 hypothetical protein [Legionella sp. 27cVA30]RUQ84990.1 hypothetical protein EKM59_07990 [Legionella septentrionalis]RUR02374.1 hypothetical protein ELY11_01195 [Legionella septentrionalis]RUR10317.1 hypothetical protein ELY14_05445 [Legionella septentrionalis]RUR17031.1 hypothetical protein ELY10_01395 [Legionella septentrionalis]